MKEFDEIDRQPDPEKPGEKAAKAELERRVRHNVSHNENIARYVIEDLEELADLTHIDLADELQIPLEYYQRKEDIIPLLCDDLTHMLIDGLITGFHILLRDRELDPNTGAYPAHYHAQYIFDSQSPDFVDGGGLIALPREALSNARFVLLVDWNKHISSRNRLPRRPEYNFDWVPESARYDTQTVQLYRQSGKTINGIRVQRIEKK